MIIQQTVYISGAGSGIGQALAKTYAKLGANLALFDLAISDETRKTMDQEKTKESQKIGYYTADVTALDGLLNGLANAELQIGLPSLVLHCAGIQKAGTFDTVSSEEFENVVSVNLFGSRNFAEGCLPLLKKNNEPSKMVFVASMAGLVGTFAYASYSASKFGVVGLAQALRMELAPDNVKVQVICPPEVNTPMVVEEHKTIHPVTLKLKMMAGTLSLDEAIIDIMKGLKGDRFLIIPGRMARLTYWMSRLIPLALSNAFVDFMIKKELNKNGSKTRFHDKTKAHDKTKSLL